MDAREAASQTAIPESLVPPSGSKKNSCFFCAGAHGKGEAQPVTSQNQRTLGGTGGHAHLATAKNDAMPCQFTVPHRQGHRDQGPKACRPGGNSPFPLNPKMKSAFS